MEKSSRDGNVRPTDLPLEKSVCRSRSNSENWLIEKDPDAGADWRQEEKGTTEDKMVGWHHQINGHEFEHASGVGDGQGGLSCTVHGVATSQTQLSDWTELNSISALLMSSFVPFIKIPHISNIIWYFYFSAWLTSLILTTTSSIHIAADSTMLLFFYDIVMFPQIFLINSSLDEHLCCFYVPAIANSVAVNIEVYIFF